MTPVQPESPDSATPDATPPPAADRAPPPRIEPSVPARESRGATWRTLGALLLLAILVAAAALGWQWWEQRTRVARHLESQDAALTALRTQTEALAARAEEQAARLADQSRLTDRNGTDIAALQSRIDDTLGLMSRISEDLSGGRTRFQLAAVEHLLVLANDRLLLERDVRSALVALDAADARLAALSDPQLFAVREALAQERTALRAVPAADRTSAALTLASLIERAPRLPLVSHAPAQFKSPEARAEVADAGGPEGWQRMWAAVRAAASSLFTIRREDNARALRLLPPEAEAVVFHVLVLKLESARVALLSADTVALREAARSADAWLEAEFKPDDPGVLAMRGELDRLQTLELAPPLPDTSRSLAALRAHLDRAR
jgi:uncharacterized protein HemX